MSTNIKIVCQNRKARHDYFILDEYEAGMVLLGTEVKSLRLGRANIKDSHAKMRRGEVFLHNMHIGIYPFAAAGNHDPERPRKLLLHKQEIKRLTGKIVEKGHTLVQNITKVWNKKYTYGALFQGWKGKGAAGPRQGEAKI